MLFHSPLLNERPMSKTWLIAVCLVAGLASAAGADRDLLVKAGEKKSFKLPGVAQVAVDDASVVDVTTAADVLNLSGKRVGSSRLLVLLKNDQWVTYTVRVSAAGEVPTAPDKRKPQPVDGIAVHVSGEVLLKTPDVEAVEIEDDSVAEVRIVSESRVVVRGLAEGETAVLITRAGRVERRPVTVE